MGSHTLKPVLRCLSRCSVAASRCCIASGRCCVAAAGAALPPAGAALPPAGAALPPAGAALPPAGAPLPPAGAALPPAGAAFSSRCCVASSRCCVASSRCCVASSRCCIASHAPRLRSPEADLPFSAHARSQATRPTQFASLAQLGNHRTVAEPLSSLVVTLLTTIGIGHAQKQSELTALLLPTGRPSSKQASI